MGHQFPVNTFIVMIFLLWHFLGAMAQGKIKTSPPSARVAAMSAMQLETSLKHFDFFFENSLKHH